MFPWMLRTRGVLLDNCLDPDADAGRVRRACRQQHFPGSFANSGLQSHSPILSADDAAVLRNPIASLSGFSGQVYVPVVFRLHEK